MELVFRTIENTVGYNRTDFFPAAKIIQSALIKVVVDCGDLLILLVKYGENNILVGVLDQLLPLCDIPHRKAAPAQRQKGARLVEHREINLLMMRKPEVPFVPAG